MNTIAALWLPILLSSVFVFVLSAILHMVLGYHNKDFKKLPDEDGVMDALRKFNIPPGDYAMPCAGSSAGMRNPDFKAKMDKGPVALMSFMKSGQPKMGKPLVLWFCYCVVVSVFAAYITSRAVGWGTPYLNVFRFAGCSAFMCYALALPHESIWFNRSWSTTIKSILDGLLYALVTGGVFGWLWPKM